MNVQINEQRQERFAAPAGTDARIETANVERTKFAAEGSRGVETSTKGRISLIQQDYERAIEIVSQLVGASFEQLTSRRREDTLALARMIVAWWLCDEQEYTRHDISKVFCRDRSTIYYYCRKFPELLGVGDKKATRLYDAFIDEINK
jgi:chromosomal replication initiation ATPase DnaA